MRLLSYLFPQNIETYNSNYNGKILVKEFFGRKYIEVGGLMQSGRLIEQLFNKGFRYFHLKKQVGIQNILLLGVGGGTLVQLFRKYFPKAAITGVEIDSVIIEVGKQHFSLENSDLVHIVINNAFDTSLSFPQKFDLIFVDLFHGYEIPEQLSDAHFLKKVQGLLTKNGMVIFNRLYFQKYISEAELFLDKVKKIYHSVDTVTHFCNILIKAQ